MIKNINKINQWLAIGFCIGFGMSIGVSVSEKLIAKFGKK